MPRRLDFQELLAGAVASRVAVGGALALADDEGRVECAVGITSTISRIPVDPTTVFRLESLTKLITTTVILQLRDAGLLGLDDPALEHLPLDAADAALRVATIRHLLSHQSGLPDLPYSSHFALEPSLERTAEQLAQLPLLFAPGANLSYSGAGYILLGAIVERVTGLSWETAVREGVLKPLGLAHSCVSASHALAHRAAPGHVLRPGRDEPEVVTEPLPRGLASATGMFASATDLLALASLYAGGGQDGGGVPVISERSRIDATRGERPLSSGFAPGLLQGLGWQVAEWGGRRFLMHHSFGRGSAGHVLVELASGRGFAVLVNSETGENVCIDLSRTLLRELFGVAIPAFPERAGTDAVAARYAGTYVHDDGRRYFAEAQPGNGLTLRVTNTHGMARDDSVTAPIRPVDDARFVRGSGYVLFGDFDAAGVAHTLHVENQLARRTS